MRARAAPTAAAMAWPSPVFSAGAADEADLAGEMTGQQVRVPLEPAACEHNSAPGRQRRDATADLGFDARNAPVTVGQQPVGTGPRHDLATAVEAALEQAHD